MMRAAYHNLGCKVNSYELDKIRSGLEQSGFITVPFDSISDVYIVNTCTVTSIADHKSRQFLRKARQQNPEGIVVAVGCYVDVSDGEHMDDGIIDLCIPNSEKDRTVEIILSKLKNKTGGRFSCLQHSEQSSMKTEGPSPCLHDFHRSRVFIKIQDGCDNFCSYCIIPYARGRVKSRQPQDILREVHSLAESGFRELVVTGIHISSYGKDFPADNEKEPAKNYNFHLVKLLKDINAISGISRIRLGSLEPGLITPAFVKEIITLEKLCPHFHLSLQSGSDSVLKRMNRHYDTDKYKKSVEMLREAFSHPAITTDMITGFPGETKEEFTESLNYAREIGFADVHVFPYSKRQGTRAADMPGQLTEKEKKARANQLSVEVRLLHREYLSYYLDKNVEVLWESPAEIDGTLYIEGVTREYCRVYRPLNEMDPKGLQGSISEVQIHSVNDRGLFCMP